MRKIKFIGESKLGTWTSALTLNGIYELYNSPFHNGALVIRNDYYVALELTSDRLKEFEEVKNEIS